MLKEFQERIRPVVDRSVQEASERSRALSQGATGNDPAHPQNPGILVNLNEFSGRYPFLFQGVLGAALFGACVYGVYLAKLTYNAQPKNDELARARVSVDERLVEALERLAVDDDRQAELLRDLLNAVDRANELSRQNATRNNDDFVSTAAYAIRTIKDLIYIGRFFRNTFGKPSGAGGGSATGHRDPGDEDFSTPPSGQAHMERKMRNNKDKDTI